MENVKELILKFLNGNLSQKDYLILNSYVIKEVKKLSERYEIELNEKDVAHDFLIHIMKKNSHFQKLIENNKFSIAYFKTSLKNFVIDIIKRKVEVESIDKILEEEKGKIYLERALSEPSKVLEYIEYREFIEEFDKKVNDEEIKILCYLYDKNYKCFWRDKTEAALYKHVSRNRNKIIEKLKEIIMKLKVEENTFEEFIKKYLSVKCEQLRSIYCKED